MNLPTAVSFATLSLTRLTCLPGRLAWVGIFIYNSFLKKKLVLCYNDFMTNPSDLIQSRSALCIDLDGTLINTDTLYFLAAEKLAQVHQAPPIPEADFSEHFGNGNFLNFLKNWVNWPANQPDFNAHYYSLFDYSQTALKPGALTLLTKAYERNTPVCIVSNASRDWIEQRLAAVNLGHFVTAISSGDTVERHKPAPDLYLKALETLAEQLGHSVSSTPLAVEDSLSGAASAEIAGCEVCLVPNRFLAPKVAIYPPQAPAPAVPDPRPESPELIPCTFPVLPDLEEVARYYF